MSVLPRTKEDADRILEGLKFHPLDNMDREVFAGADGDGICYTGDMAVIRSGENFRFIESDEDGTTLEVLYTALSHRMDLPSFLAQCPTIRWFNVAVIDGLSTPAMFVIAPVEGKAKKALTAITQFMLDQAIDEEWSAILFCGKIILGRETH